MKHQGKTFADIKALFFDINSRPDATIIREHNTTKALLEDEKTMYIFTLANHEAHPSVIVRRVIEEKGIIKLQTTGHTMANQKYFEAWLKEVRQVDSKIKNNFNLKH